MMWSQTLTASGGCRLGRARARATQHRPVRRAAMSSLANKRRALGGQAPSNYVPGKEYMMDIV